MSAETREWLSTNTLIGFTDTRGHAWHHREGDNNTFPGPIPVDDVQRRLFSWTAEERMVYVQARDGFPEPIPGRKAIVRSDNDTVMGLFKDGYQPHQYSQWLVTNVAAILDADLGIGSAGLLKGGAVAWVSVEVPESIKTPEGVEFRPNLLACTSFDGSLSTTYKRVVTNVVCDNTMAAGLSEHGQQFKVKHSARSLTRISDARSALAIVHTVADAFAAEVAALCRKEVTDREFDRLVREEFAPLPKEEGKTSRGRTMAQNKQHALLRLWRHDERVAPWRGTAYGAYQAVSTYQQHEATTRGAVRAERNMLNAIEGKTEASDTAVIKVLASV